MDFRTNNIIEEYLTEQLDVFTPDEFYKYLKSRVGILDAVVITGGEPTLHPDLVDEIRKIKGLPVARFVRICCEFFFPTGDMGIV